MLVVVSRNVESRRVVSPRPSQNHWNDTEIGRSLIGSRPENPSLLRLPSRIFSFSREESLATPNLVGRYPRWSRKEKKFQNAKRRCLYYGFRAVSLCLSSSLRKTGIFVFVFRYRFFVVASARNNVRWKFGAQLVRRRGLASSTEAKTKVAAQPNILFQRADRQPRERLAHKNKFNLSTDMLRSTYTRY